MRWSRSTCRAAGVGRPTLTQVTIADFVAAVVDEIVDDDLQDVVLVGHSLAGVTLPGVVGAVPDRLRHVVFVSAAVPPDQGRVIDTLDPGMREYAEHSGCATPTRPPPSTRSSRPRCSATTWTRP